MRRSGFTLLQAIGVLALILVIAAILFPIFGRSRETPGRGRACPNNLSQIAIGLRGYIGDNDEKFPPVSSGRMFIADTPFGWADAIQPYTKSLQVLQCPSEPTSPNPDPTQTGYTDYWYNANCAGRNEKSFTSVMNTVISGDGADGGGDGGGDARYSVTREVNTTAETSRHREGNNFAFADGHVKWFKPGSISATQSPTAGYSFNIK